MAAADLAALAPLLASEVGELAGPLRSALMSGGRSNPTYELTDGARSWVLRRPPRGDLLPSAHDMSREVRFIAALADTEVPVPTCVLWCEDAAVIGAPFYVMDRIEGVVLKSVADVVPVPVADRSALARRMVEVLAALHALDPAEVGLAGLGRPDGYLSRQVSRWGRQWDAVRTRELPIVTELLDHLGSTLPAQSRPGLVHGDFKLDNVMLDRDDPSSILAVLDWEMATVGDTLADLGILISFWDEPGAIHNPLTAGATALEGFPSVAEMIDMYLAASGVGDLPYLDWYLVFADFKIAVILEQIHARHLRGETDGSHFDEIGAMVEPLLERAIGRAGRSPLRRGTVAT